MNLQRILLALAALAIVGAAGAAQQLPALTAVKLAAAEGGAMWARSLPPIYAEDEPKPVRSDN